MRKEKRRARRVNTAIEVKWGFAKDCPYEGTIINLTVLGCAIQNKAGIEVKPGQTILVRFWSPRKQILKIEVIHNLLKAEGVQGFGAKFLELTEKEKETLEQLVQLFGEPESTNNQMPSLKKANDPLNHTKRH
ncbi:MAG: PilZ domain-containing protein [Acidobacteriota bacterium]